MYSFYGQTFIHANTLSSLVVAYVHVIPINRMERIHWMSYSLSGDTIIRSSSTGLDCRGLYDRRSQDELWVSACERLHVGVKGKGLGCRSTFINVSIIWLRCHGCSNDMCVCVHVHVHVHGILGSQVLLWSFCSLFSLLTNPIPLCHCQFQVLSLWNVAPADFNRTNWNWQFTPLYRSSHFKTRHSTVRAASQPRL